MTARFQKHEKLLSELIRLRKDWKHFAEKNPIEVRVNQDLFMGVRVVPFDRTYTFEI